MSRKDAVSIMPRGHHPDDIPATRAHVDRLDARMSANRDELIATLVGFGGRLAELGDSLNESDARAVDRDRHTQQSLTDLQRIIAAIAEELAQDRHDWEAMRVEQRAIAASLPRRWRARVRRYIRSHGRPSPGRHSPRAANQRTTPAHAAAPARRRGLPSGSAAITRPLYPYHDG